MYYNPFASWHGQKKKVERLEHRNDDITNTFAFQHFEYYASVKHDEKRPQSKFSGNQFMGPN